MPCAKVATRMALNLGAVGVAVCAVSASLRRCAQPFRQRHGNETDAAKVRQLYHAVGRLVCEGRACRTTAFKLCELLTERVGMGVDFLT